MSRAHLVSVETRQRDVVLFVGTGALATAVVAVGSLGPSAARLTLAVAGLWLILSLGLAAPTALLYALIGWLSVLGFVRRVTSLAFPAGHTDPLLLIEPVAAGVLVLVAIARGGLMMRSGLSKATVVLAVLMLAGSLNPAQGSAATGLAGLLFGLVPICGFWIGRAFCDDRMFDRILGFVGGFGLAAAVYGLAQTFVGFPSWDTAWISDAGYAALSVGGVIRAFASFPSASEYALFVAIALVAWLAYGGRLARVWFSGPAVVVLAVALVYESARSVMFLVPVALVLMTLARFRGPLGLSLAAAAAAVLLVPLAVGYLVPAPSGGAPSSALIEHQVSGLQHPLSDSSSTLSLHAKLVASGLRTALHEPLGVGTGAVTLAGSKFGPQSQNTEADPSNAAVALGIPGLLAYVFILCAGFRQAYSLAARRRDPRSLAALGLLAVTALQWLNGGQYAVALLVWLTLGWTDRSTDADRAATAALHSGARR